MTTDTARSPTAVARILYKEVVAGDRRKIEAESNDSDTGGGARDFRFGEFHELRAVIRKMFPTAVREVRRRQGRPTEVELFGGRFWWDFSGKVESKAAVFEPPTDVRPNEGRITRVHEQPCFSRERIPPHEDGNKVLLLLLQRNDETVWPYFLQESTLSQEGLWDPRVAAELLKCIKARRASNRAVIGFYDFVTGESYCNGT